MMLPVVLLLQPVLTPYPIPQDTPAAVARCLDDAVETLKQSPDSDAVVADKAFAACRTSLDRLVAARDAFVTKDAGYPPPPGNSAAWRADTVRSFQAMALQYVTQARRR